MTADSDSPLRVLVLSPLEPCPTTNGTRTVVYNDAKFLARRGHKITFLAVTYEPDADPTAISEFAQAEYFRTPKPPQWYQVMRNFGEPRPYTIVRQRDNELLARAVELVSSGQIDVILVEDGVMGEYARLIKDRAPVPAYMHGHNATTNVFERYYKSQRNPIMRYLGWRQFVKFRRFEGNVVETFDYVSQISPTDAELVDQLNPRVKNDVLYAGVDLDYFAYAPAEARDPNTLMHVGTLDQTTKLPAMIWFYDSVLPVIRKRFPDVRLELVGRTPPCKLHQADPSDVVVHGLVPDVRPYLAKGAVFVATQFVGSGIRIKILNAMSAGNAVVSTSIAAEGLPVTHGRDIFIADDAQTFADQVCELLANPARRGDVGHRARKLVEESFAWPRISERLEEHLRETIRRHAARGGQASRQ